MEQVFRCQSCRAKLNIGGMDSLGGGADAAQTSPVCRHTINANSVLGGSKIDESFIVLDNGAKKGAQSDNSKFSACKLTMLPSDAVNPGKLCPATPDSKQHLLDASCSWHYTEYLFYR